MFVILQLNFITRNRIINDSHLSYFSNHETYITCTCIIYVDHNHDMLNNKNYYYLTFQEVGITKYCYDWRYGIPTFRDIINEFARRIMKE